MPDNIAISVKHVSKAFKLPHEKHTSVKGALINFFRSGRRTYERQQVLNDISFEIKQGEFFGIVGRNGSGKSTLLKLLAGIYTPTDGEIVINGKLTPFIELGVGFNPELTGRENVYLNGALLGFNRREMDDMYNDIVAFAELERFMDQKLKNYSSGMQVRLAFSIAIRAESQILVLDEVLAVGDAIFQKKCFDYFKQLKRSGRTVVFVSHDAGALQEYCDNGVLIESGKIVRKGKIDIILREYADILNKVESKGDEADGQSSDEAKKKRWGSRKAVITSLSLSSDSNARKRIFAEEEPVTVSLEFSCKQDLQSPVAGITVTDLSGQIIFQSNTLWCKQPLRDMEEGSTVRLQWSIPNAFNTGTYMVAPAIADAAGVEIFDWVEDMAQFKVRKEQKSHGYINAKHEIEVRYEEAGG